MKKEFSKHWKSSKQPRKQRKYTANAPLNTRKNLLSVNLSKNLRKKHNTRNVIVIKGDTVKILRGKFKKKQGKILKVNHKTSMLTIENIQIKKQDGSKADVKLRPSNLQILELNLKDSKRKIAGKKATTSTTSPTKKVEKGGKKNALEKK